MRPVKDVLTQIESYMKHFPGQRTNVFTFLSKEKMAKQYFITAFFAC